MKFTRSTWITTFVMLFLVAAVVLYLMYSGASKDNKLAQNNLDAAQSSQTALNKIKANLAAQMAQAVADVAGWNDKVALLQAELAQANLSLLQIESIFPSSAQTIEYNETLIGLAKSSNLTMSLLVATEPAKGDLSTSNFTFYINVFNISVSGKVSDILDFVDKVATSGAFKTGAIPQVTFTIPQPLSQAAIDKMREAIKTQMIAVKDASITAEARVALIEQALLTLLGENSSGPTVAQMTQTIHDVITRQFSPSIADLLSNEIALAIENNLADSLISKVADVYSKAIAALFTTDDYAKLLPVFNGPLGAEITAAIQNIPASEIETTVKTVITNALTSMVADKIAAMVSDSDIDAALAAQITAAEMPSAQLTVGVYSYKGD